MKKSRMVGRSDTITKATVSFVLSFAPRMWLFSSKSSFTRFLITRKLRTRISRRFIFMTAKMRTLLYFGRGRIKATSLYSIMEKMTSRTTITAASNLSLFFFCSKSELKLIGL